MKRFKISELDCFSDVKAHTIRIWEQRYNIFKPSRTEGNIRYYSLDEVKLLLDIALLLQHGHKISQLSKINAVTLTEMVDDLTAPEAIPLKAINDLIILMFNSEIEEFEDVLDGCVHMLGIDATVREVILPFIGRVQLLSYSNSNSYIHFAVTALRRKIIAAIESANPPAMTQKSALLFLAEREHYDLILLYTAYILKCKGIRVLYMGTNVSLQNLEQVTASKMPELLFTFIPQKQRFLTGSFLTYLNEIAPQSKLFVLVCDKELPVSKYHNLQFMQYNEVKDIVLDAPVLV